MAPVLRTVLICCCYLCFSVWFCVVVPSFFLWLASRGRAPVTTTTTTLPASTSTTALATTAGPSHFGGGVNISPCATLACPSSHPFHPACKARDGICLDQRCVPIGAYPPGCQSDDCAGENSLGDACVCPCSCLDEFREVAPCLAPGSTTSTTTLAAVQLLQMGNCSQRQCPDLQAELPDCTDYMGECVQGRCQPFAFPSSNCSDDPCAMGAVGSCTCSCACLDSSGTVISCRLLDTPPPTPMPTVSECPQICPVADALDPNCTNHEGTCMGGHCVSPAFLLSNCSGSLCAGIGDGTPCGCPCSCLNRDFHAFACLRCPMPDASCQSNSHGQGVCMRVCAESLVDLGPCNTVGTACRCCSLPIVPPPTPAPPQQTTLTPPTAQPTPEPTVSQCPQTCPFAPALDANCTDRAGFCNNGHCVPSMFLSSNCTNDICGGPLADPMAPCVCPCSCIGEQLRVASCVPVQQTPPPTPFPVQQTPTPTRKPTPHQLTAAPTFAPVFVLPTPVPTPPPTPAPTRGLLCNESLTPLIITGVFNGALPGDLPLSVEMFALRDIADLSEFAVRGGADIGLFGNALAGSYLFLTNNATAFLSFFTIPANFTNASLAINGTLSVQLLHNGTVVDTFGDENVTCNLFTCEYTDGWGYRRNNSLAMPVWNQSDWLLHPHTYFANATKWFKSTKRYPACTYRCDPEGGGGGSVTPTAQPTLHPPLPPTPLPTRVLTPAPTGSPTFAPTPSPTERPTANPTEAPTPSPTDRRTSAPTENPTAAPTPAPTFEPTGACCLHGIIVKRVNPCVENQTLGDCLQLHGSWTGFGVSCLEAQCVTFAPTSVPTQSPTPNPTSNPTASPTFSPTPAPTDRRTSAPTPSPTGSPTFSPTPAPTPAPTFEPQTCDDRSACPNVAFFNLCLHMPDACVNGTCVTTAPAVSGARCQTSGDCPCQCDGGDEFDRFCTMPPQICDPTECPGANATCVRDVIVSATGAEAIHRPLVCNVSRVPVDNANPELCPCVCSGGSFPRKLCSFSEPDTCPNNALINPGWEIIDFSDWFDYLGNTSGVAVSSLVMPRQGFGQFMLNLTSKVGAFYKRQNVAVQLGANVFASVYAKAEALSNIDFLDMNIECLNSSGAQIGLPFKVSKSLLSAINGTYKFLSMNYTVPPNPAITHIRFFLGAECAGAPCSGRIFFDDACITVSPQELCTCCTQFGNTIPNATVPCTCFEQVTADYCTRELGGSTVGCGTFGGPSCNLSTAICNGFHPSCNSTAGRNGETASRYKVSIKGGNLMDVSLAPTPAACCGGTSGAIVRSTTHSPRRYYLLSNSHVYAPEAMVPASRNIGDPSLIDTTPACTASNSTTVGFLRNWTITTKIDAAVAELRWDLRLYNLQMPIPLITMDPSVVEAAIGMPVIKNGRTTGLTTNGTVLGLFGVGPIFYPTSCGSATGTNKSFTGQIVVTGSGFSAGGDSGAIVLTNSVPAFPIGLLFAGSASDTIVNPMTDVLSAFGIEFYDFGEYTGVLKKRDHQTLFDTVEYENFEHTFECYDTYDWSILDADPQFVIRYIGLDGSGNSTCIHVRMENGAIVTEQEVPVDINGTEVMLEFGDRLVALGGSCPPHQ